MPVPWRDSNLQPAVQEMTADHLFWAIH